MYTERRNAKGNDSKQKEERKEKKRESIGILLSFLVLLKTAGAETFVLGSQTNRVFLSLCRRRSISPYSETRRVSTGSEISVNH